LCRPSLESLLNTSYKNYNIIIVDNGSTDASITYVTEKFRSIKVIYNKRKPGFAGGVNTGIEYAIEHGAEYIAIYSNDIKVIPQWIEYSLHGFYNNSNIGLVGFVEIQKENEELFYNYENTNNIPIFKEEKSVAGCLFICSAELFKNIGLMHEDYYMYGEDNDLFARILKSNYRIVQSTIPVWHYGEGFSMQNNFLSTWLAYRNALRFSIKNENLIMIFRMLISLLNQGCNPFYKPKIEHPSYLRLTRYNSIININLIIFFVSASRFAWCHRGKPAHTGLGAPAPLRPERCPSRFVKRLAHRAINSARQGQHIKNHLRHATGRSPPSPVGSVRARRVHRAIAAGPRTVPSHRPANSVGHQSLPVGVGATTGRRG